MSNASHASLPFTLTDIDVGARLVEVLIEHVKHTGGDPIAYADLLTLGRKLYPKDAMLGREVPVGIGAKLSFVQAFFRTNQYPDLSCLAVNKLTMKPWPGCNGDWKGERRSIAGFDWAGAGARAADFADKARSAVPKRFKPRKERPADVAWYAYYCSHRAACAHVAVDDKKEIINLLMAGLDPETALQRVMAAKAELGELS